MQPIKLLIVDDSFVVRRLISKALSEEPSIEIVGVAENGQVALLKLSQLNPDFILLDLEMPDMNGLETIQEIRKCAPKLPILVFSALSERGAMITLEALSLGANDYITKPQQMKDVQATLIYLREALIPRIQSLAITSCSFPVKLKTPPLSPPTKKSNQTAIDIVVIGASTGGPNALDEILVPLPKNFPVPILIVQHMPPVFTRSLAERLNTKCQIPVYEASLKQPLDAGTIWIAPGDHHLFITQQGNQVFLETNQNPPQNFCRPSVDHLFQSVAPIYKSHTLAVILTGMGQDGLMGCRQISDYGGQIFAQDEASSVVWGMPGSVVRAGLADKVLPLNTLAIEIEKRVFVGRFSPKTKSALSE